VHKWNSIKWSLDLDSFLCVLILGLLLLHWERGCCHKCAHTLTTKSLNRVLCLPFFGNGGPLGFRFGFWFWIIAWASSCALSCLLHCSFQHHESLFSSGWFPSADAYVLPFSIFTNLSQSGNYLLGKSHMQVLVRALSLACRQPPLAVPSHGRERQSVFPLVSSYKSPDPIMRTPPSWPLLTLNNSQRPHLQTLSDWGLAFNIWMLGGHR